MPRPSEAGRRRALLAALAAATAAPLARRAVAAPRETVRLGQSVPLSGPAQQLGIEYQRGLRLAFEAANATEALPGRQIELVSLDDQYEPAVALENTRDLLQEGVLALVGYVGTESTLQALSLAARQGVPVVAPLSGAEALRQRPPRWLVHLRPGLVAETGLIVRTLATMGLRQVAVLQQADADGAAGLSALTESLAQAGLPAPLTVATVARNTTGATAPQQAELGRAAQQLAAARPQAIVFLAAHASTAGVLTQLRQGGFAGGAYATSLSSAAAIGPLLGRHAAGFSMTQVMPSPTDASRPVVAAYLQRLRAAGQAAPEYVSLEGWIAGQMVVEALRRGPRNGGREALLAGLESLQGWDAGGFALRWDPQRRQASSQVAMTVLDGQGRPLR